jgi:hypothetical protein
VNAAFVVSVSENKAGSPVHVKLTSKLAESLDGIDVSHARVGDVLDLSESEANLLIAEGWAEGVCDADAANEPGTAEGRRATGSSR